MRQVYVARVTRTMIDEMASLRHMVASFVIGVVCYGVGGSYALARGEQRESAETLVRRADKVVVGRVARLGATGGCIFLTYPTLRGYPFEVCRARIDVIEGLKNARDGEAINMFYLRRGVTNEIRRALIANPPSSLHLKVSGEVYLLFLRQTSVTNWFCAYTEPYDPVNSVFDLGVTNWTKSDEEKVSWPLVLEHLNQTTGGMNALRDRFRSLLGTTNETVESFEVPPEIGGDWEAGQQSPIKGAGE